MRQVVQMKCKNLIICWDAVAPEIMELKEFDFPHSGNLLCLPTRGEDWSCTLTSMISLYRGKIWNKYCNWEKDFLLNDFENELIKKGSWGLVGIPWLYPIPEDLKGWAIVSFPNPSMPKCSDKYEKHGKAFTEGLESDFNALNDAWNEGVYDPIKEYELKAKIIEKTPYVDNLFIEFDSVNRGYYKVARDEKEFWKGCLEFTYKMLDLIKPETYVIFSDHGRPKSPKGYSRQGMWASNLNLNLKTFEDLIEVLHRNPCLSDKR